MSELVVSCLDVTRLAVASFLARDRQPNSWLLPGGPALLPAVVLRGRGRPTAGHPADAVTRPKVEWQGQRRTVLHPLEFAALLAAARSAGGADHALVALLGMLGLRVSEACHADIDDIRYQSGYEILHVLGRGGKPADIPLPIPVLRASREHGPILLSSHGHRMDTGGAARRLRRLCACAGIDHRIGPHSLRRTFCTTRLGRQLRFRVGDVEAYLQAAETGR